MHVVLSHILVALEACRSVTLSSGARKLQLKLPPVWQLYRSNCTTVLPVKLRRTWSNLLLESSLTQPCYTSCSQTILYTDYT